MNEEKIYKVQWRMLVSCCAFVNYLIAEYGKINGELK